MYGFLGIEQNDCSLKSYYICALAGEWNILVVFWVIWDLIWLVSSKANKRTKVGLFRKYSLEIKYTISEERETILFAWKMGFASREPPLSLMRGTKFISR